MIHVVGSINLDLIATLDRLPRPGETLSGNGFATAPGGKGANQALAARRAGASVAMTGAVGRDPFAAQALSLLEDAAVDLSRVKEDTAPTGTALILVGGDGENMIAVVPGANAQVAPPSPSELPIAGGDVLLLQHEIPLDTVAQVLRQARVAGALSILNTAPARPERADLLGLADIVVANETEFDLYAIALALGGSDRAAQMDDFVRRTGRSVIVTLGSEGAIAATPDGTARADAAKISPVDTVGAGDTFCGYLAAGLAEGMALDRAMRLAAVAGSLACLRPGAQPAIPMRGEVDAAL
jgi:ribokinase